MSIIKSNLGPFLLQVGIPFVIAVGASFAVYAGYSNLKNQINTQNDLEEKAEKINQAFNRIGEQEAALLGQKSELVKQKVVTENLNAEYLKQKEFNELLNQIQIFSLGARNGSIDDFRKFYAFAEIENLDLELINIWSKEYDRLRKVWESELEKVNFYRLYLNPETKERRNWSIEYLYGGISNLGTNKSWAYNNKDFIAYFKEIEVTKSKYFVETLYKIATEGKNINYSIIAAKTLCSITEFEPYPYQSFKNSYKQLLIDIPEFVNLKKWWEKEGSKIKLYTCPLDIIVDYNRNYYAYDRSFEGTDVEKLKALNAIINDYPLLSRTKAEIAYLKLDGPSTYSEVEKLANESIAGTDMEPLPYLLIAYIALKQNDLSKMDEFLILASKSIDKKKMITTVQLNKKLHELFIGIERNNLFEE